MAPTNRLVNEESAYLRQHQNNPIQWYSYGEEALQKAREKNAPIFLSIGYSTCHWCHVMAHESFENAEVAAILNESFVAIKVDREEFPDLDFYFQQACQMYTGRGGWPLSVFLTPELKPFFAGTYFPLNARENQPGFIQVLNELKRVYYQEPQIVKENSERCFEEIEKALYHKPKMEFGDGHFPSPNSVMKALEKYQDKEMGGFGDAPKFPCLAFIEWGLEHSLEGVMEKDWTEHILLTLRRMLQGGLFDHVKGGIHRYSTDKKYLVPHFEKMLYDQAGLLKVLSRASLLSPDPLILDALFQTLDYLETEMLSEHHYFFTAQDADSDGEEGIYFVYTEEEFEAAIKDYKEGILNTRIDDLKRWHQITKEGNFHSGLNVISLDPSLANEYLKEDQWNLVRQCRDALLVERRERIPPLTDNKGISGLNFMMVTALVDVLQYSQIPPLKERASRMLQRIIEPLFDKFLVKIHTDEKGMHTRIHHSSTRASTPLYFEDYAYFAEVNYKLYQFYGEEVFLKNFELTMEGVLKTYFKDQRFFTRPLTPDDPTPYPNVPLKYFDHSYKAAPATFLSLLRKGGLLLDESWNEDYGETIEEAKHEVLQNPLMAGEGLRALTYPLEAYRVLKVHPEWAKEPEFKEIQGFLPERFIIKYSETEKSDFQICHNTGCEFKGKGIQELRGILFPGQEQEKKED